MKKIIVVLFIFMIVFSEVQEKRNFTLLDYFAGEYTCYSNISNSEKSIDLGFCFANNDIENNKIGESIVVENLEVGSALNELKASVLKTEYLDDGTVVIYAKSSLINESVGLSFGEINLQIATKEDRAVIGWPLIIGSY